MIDLSYHDGKATVLGKKKRSIYMKLNKSLRFVYSVKVPKVHKFMSPPLYVYIL